MLTLLLFLPLVSCSYFGGDADGYTEEVIESQSDSGESDIGNLDDDDEGLEDSLEIHSSEYYQ